MGEIGFAISEFARSGKIETAELVEKGGLAAAGRAKQYDELTGVEIEIDAVQRANLGGALAINFRQAADVENGSGRRG